MIDFKVRKQAAVSGNLPDTAVFVRLEIVFIFNWVWAGWDNCF
ncbi:conserved hypothetical protein [Neisseria gonorrhoeae DGI2]|uniref:Uncharacterized protein n=1 Tax=Neisseria gonorrhoeae (strain NCCP11945) TaxID=521006 RepID=B4RPT5_NEIG2|nr:Hypothetical protein NGK_2358 [Neisseria gonorrhoeae NCCP11945]EFE05114.1 conserved hypothetical protein [Neisseria gonorrhoeae DGI2]